MNLLIIMSAAFCIGQIIPEVIQPYLFRLKKRFGLRRLKPFDCSACLSFWSALFLSLGETNIKISILSSTIVFSLTVKYELKKYE
jgi:hypothetical protein